jgi:rubrerythrin
MAIEQARDTRTSLPAGVRSSSPEDAPPRGPRLELRCVECGYGAISAKPIRCPMCGGEDWDFAEWRPFSS